MEKAPKLGARFRAKPSERCWPFKVIPWLGLGVATAAIRVRLTPDKLEKGNRLCSRRAAAPGGQRGVALRVLPGLPRVARAWWIWPYSKRLGRRESFRRNG